MQFKTQRLIVRPFCDADKEKMLEMLYDESIKKTYMIPDFPDREAAERMFAAFMRLSDAPERYVGAISLGDALIGFMNDTEIVDVCVEMGYVISPEYQNKGYCTEAMKGAIGYLFEKGFSAVVCGAFEENIASKRVMQKCGMKLMNRSDVIKYRGKEHRCIYYSIENC